MIMWKKHKNKDKWQLSYPIQIFWWIIIISMSFIIWYRTLQVFNVENLTRINENPSLTNNITILEYYVYWV